MSREIKFRVWDGKEMCEPPPLNEWDMEDGEFWVSYCDNPIMQFTGLKDKNGKDIYDGDIVRFTMSGKEYQRPVVWNPSGMWSIGWNGTPNPGPMRGEYDVIGNIHENPELLEP